MFEEIIATFLKVLPLALLLILAFGQPFFILLGPITIESDVSNLCDTVELNCISDLGFNLSLQWNP